MTKPLTPKQEKFAQGVASGMSQADAYRAAYAVKGKSITAIEAASRLMADSNISARVAELRLPIAEAAKITLADHITELAAIRDRALGDSKPAYAAAVSAQSAIARALGLEKPQDINLNLTGDGKPITGMAWTIVKTGKDATKSKK